MTKAPLCARCALVAVAEFLNSGTPRFNGRVNDVFLHLFVGVRTMAFGRL